MMGRTHAATGVLAGLLLGPALGLAGLAEIGPFAAACAGYALLPDLDHPSSTATRKLGLITRGVSVALRAMSGALYRATKGPKDEPGDGVHRHGTHTAAFAGLLGVACWASTVAWGGWGVFAWLAFGLLLAHDRLGALVLAPLGITIAGWLPHLADPAALRTAVLTSLDQCAGWLGIAVAAGALVHCLGDALTKSGCPVLWPLPIAGETWYEIRPPSWLRFHTGKRIERKLIFPLVLLGCIAALPGLAPHLADLITTAYADITAGAVG